MTTAARPRINLVQTGHVATVVVVVVAYVVTFVGYFADLRTPEGPSYSAAALAVSVVLGLVYLYMLIAGYQALGTTFGRHARAITFAFLIILMLAIEFLLSGSNGIWLISMPLVGTATTDLPPRSRWLVYLIVLFGMIVPIGYRYGDWQTAIIAALTFSPAIIFVIVFVRLAQTAEQAQMEAEELAAQLAEANNRLGDYAIQAEEMATVHERNRLAREIHDNLGHYLTVVNVQIQAARAMLGKDPARAAAALDKAGQLTQEGLAAVRQSVSSLRDSPLGRRALPEAIGDLAAETQAAGIVTELRVEGRPRAFNPRLELTLYRSAQEALTNVRKHARASRVDLTLDYRDPAAVSLIVSDNGLGSAANNVSPGFGLLGLQERARQLGGQVTVDTSTGAGYRLTVHLPETVAPELADKIEDAIIGGDIPV